MDTEEHKELDQELHNYRAFTTMPDEDFWVFWKSWDEEDDAVGDENNVENPDQINFIHLFLNDDEFAEMHLKRVAGNRSEETEKLIELNELKKKFSDRVLFFELPYMVAPYLHAAGLALNLDRHGLKMKRYERIISMTPREFSDWMHHIFKNHIYDAENKQWEYFTDFLCAESLENWRQADKAMEAMTEEEKADEDEELRDVIEESFSSETEPLTSEEKVKSSETIKRIFDELALSRKVSDRIAAFIASLFKNHEKPMSMTTIQNLIMDTGFRFETLANITRRGFENLSTIEIIHMIDSDPAFREVLEHQSKGTEISSKGMAEAEKEIARLKKLFGNNPSEWFKNQKN